MSSTRQTLVSSGVVLLIVVSFAATGALAGPDAFDDTSGTGVVGGPSSAVTAPSSAVTGSAAGNTASVCRVADSGTTDDGSGPGWAAQSPDTSISRGDVAVVSLSVRQNATVSVAGPSGYAVHLGVRDDGDGHLKLGINTALTGNRTGVAPDAYLAAGNDTVTVRNATTQPPFAPGNYTVRVRANGNTLDSATVRVEPAAVGNVTAYRAPGGLFNATDPETVADRLATGGERLAPEGARTGGVFDGETLVVRLEGGSLLGGFAADRRAFGYEYDERGVVGRLSLSGPCGGIALGSSLDGKAARFLPDYGAGVVYLLIDVGRAEGYVVGDQQVTVRFTNPRLSSLDRQMETEFRIGGSQETSVTTVELTNRTIRLSGDSTQLSGTTIPVRIESRVDPTVSIRTNATVRNGSFRLTVPVPSERSPYTVFVAGETHGAWADDVPRIIWAGSEQDSMVGPSTIELTERRVPLDDKLLVAYEVDRTNGTYRVLGAGTNERIFVERAAAARDVVIAVHADTDDDGEFDGPSVDPVFRLDDRAVADWLVIDHDGTPHSEPLPAPLTPETIQTTGSDQPTGTPSATTQPSSATTQPSSATTQTPSATTQSSPATLSATVTERMTAPGFGPVLAVLAVASVVAWRRHRRE